MLTRRLLIVSFVGLATGICLLAVYCNGTAGLSAGFPAPGLTLKLDITTAGPAATAGVPLTLLGALLLAIAAICAVVGEIRSALFKPKPVSDDRVLTDSPDPGAP